MTDERIDRILMRGGRCSRPYGNRPPMPLGSCSLIEQLPGAGIGSPNHAIRGHPRTLRRSTKRTVSHRSQLHSCRVQVLTDSVLSAKWIGRNRRRPVCNSCTERQHPVLRRLLLRRGGNDQEFLRPKAIINDLQKCGSFHRPRALREACVYAPGPGFLHFLRASIAQDRRLGPGLCLRSTPWSSTV